MYVGADYFDVSFRSLFDNMIIQSCRLVVCEHRDATCRFVCLITSRLFCN